MPGWKPLIGFCDPLLKVGESGTRCDFNAFITLIKHGIHDMGLISTLVVVALLCYVGFEFLTSRGNVSAWINAKKRLGKVIFGYIWVLAAWLIVYTITSALLDPKTTIEILKLK